VWMNNLNFLLFNLFLFNGYQNICHDVWNKQKMSFIMHKLREQMGLSNLQFPDRVVRKYLRQ
jgi:hypothetical protein